MDTMTSVKAIKTFFELDGGAKVAVAEMKELSAEDRKELGLLCAAELKVEVK